MASPPRPTVLLVEDDADIRAVVGEILGDEGLRVLGAAGGREALDRLQRTKSVDVILLDILMPDMDGVEFLTRRREHPSAASVPVIAMTASAQSKGLEDLGVVAWLRKPVTVEALVRTVKRYARRGAGEKIGKAAAARKRPPRGA